MGGAISQVIDDLDDVQKKKGEATDALNALNTLCEVKAKAFFDEIVSDTASAGAKLLPIDKVTAKDWQTYTKYSNDISQTADEINNAIGAFVKGDVLQGVQATIGTALNKLIGNVSSNQSERRGYAIAVGFLGGVYRVDYLLFFYEFKSEGLKTLCENALLQAWVISSVDVKDLDENTLNVVLQQGYAPKKDETEEQFTKRLQALKKMVIDELNDDKVRAAIANRKINEAFAGKINTDTNKT